MRPTVKANHISHLNQFLHISGIFMIKPTPTSITCIILEYFRHKNLRVPTGHPKILAPVGDMLALHQ